MLVSNRNILFQGSMFRGYVSFREGTPWMMISLPTLWVSIKVWPLAAEWFLVQGAYPIGGDFVGQRQGGWWNVIRWRCWVEVGWLVLMIWGERFAGRGWFGKVKGTSEMIGNLSGRVWKHHQQEYRREDCLVPSQTHTFKEDHAKLWGKHCRRMVGLTSTLFPWSHALRV